MYQPQANLAIATLTAVFLLGSTVDGLQCYDCLGTSIINVKCNDPPVTADLTPKTCEFDNSVCYKHTYGALGYSTVVRGCMPKVLDYCATSDVLNIGGECITCEIDFCNSAVGLKLSVAFVAMSFILFLLYL